MVRRKDPEGTVSRILDVAEQLFMEQGFEQTSIQQILDRLDGLSKGAIYHHFKSKEEIFVAISERSNAPIHAMFDQLATDPSLTGLEKLQRILDLAVSRPRGEFTNRVALRLLDNPRLISALMNDVFKEIAPFALRPIIQQGMEDGSIPVDDAQAFAEYLLLLVNIWLNPMVQFDSTAQMAQRFQLFKAAMDGLGIPLVDASFEAKYLDYCDQVGALVHVHSSPQSAGESGERTNTP